MVANQFTQIFRDEHRAVRDTLLDLIRAYQDQDKGRIGALLNQTATLTGPHFRYEEEALYPALVEIFGGDYIEKLLSDHDRAIGTAKVLIDLAGKERFTEGDIAKAVRLVRSVLPHVSDCDGLSIMVEKLPASTVDSILEPRAHSGRAGLDLLQWASQVRTRPIVTPE